MKKSVSILAILFTALFVSLGQISAQTPSISSTPSLQTQFPFTINGQECNTKSECKALCDDPVNTSECAALNPNATPKVDRFSDLTFASDAKTALGCSTALSCKVVCSLVANFAKCDQFAKDHQLSGGYDKRVLALEDKKSSTTDTDTELLKEAEAQLVTGDQTLKEFCDLEANQAVCSALAKKIGLNGGLKLDGPGDCQSAQTCRAYCDEPANFAECKTFEIAGLNDCTSELSCYNELQAHPEALKVALHNSAHDEEQQASGEADVAELEQTCTSVVDDYQGKSTGEFSSDLNKSHVCQFLPKSGVPGKNSNCDAYLASNQPFDKSIFDKICEVKPVIATEQLDTVDTKSLASGSEDYKKWCTDLPSVGQGGDDWQVVPALCENFVTTFTQARTECSKSESERPAWLRDSVAYTRYCLSAPSDTAKYVSACAANTTDCQSGGFDWYCAQSDSSCVPLYQGRPIDQSVETFASAGLIKDGDKVSLVLDENTQDFAEGALADTIKETGVASKFEVLSEPPKSISRSAVFMSGTGVNETQPSVFGIKFSRDVIKPETTKSVTPIISTEAFAKSWFVLDAHQETPESRSREANVTVTVTPIANKNDKPKTGWEFVKHNEADLRKKYQEEVAKTQAGTSATIPTEGFVPHSSDIKFNPDLFRLLPTSSLDHPLTEPTRLPTQYFNSGSGSTEPTKAPYPTLYNSTGTSDYHPTSTPATTYKSPTPYPTLSSSGSGSTGTSGTSGTSPSNTPYPTHLTEPTKTPIPTTNTSGSGTTAIVTPIITPTVQGIHTDNSILGIVFQFLKNLI